MHSRVPSFDLEAKSSLIFLCNVALGNEIFDVGAYRTRVAYFFDHDTCRGWPKVLIARTRCSQKQALAQDSQKRRSPVPFNASRARKRESCGRGRWRRRWV